MRLAVLCLLSSALCVHAAVDPLPADWQAWNDGVEEYDRAVNETNEVLRAASVTNAVRILRQLMQPESPKRLKMRAAEVVAKLEYDRGDLEAAADAAQIALFLATGFADDWKSDSEGFLHGLLSAFHDRPDVEKANRNFTRAVDGLPELRKAKHEKEVLESSRGGDAGSRMHSAMAEARALLSETGRFGMELDGFRTNALAVRAVTLADGLSRRTKKLADAWIPVRETIAQSCTNQEQAAACIAQVEQAQAKAKKAAQQLEDLDDTAAYGTLADVERDCTDFFVLLAQPPAAIGEDLVAQSNAWMDAEKVNGRDWQPEALRYTRTFRAKFPAWALAYEQQSQADTNRPPFTKEDQAKISALSTDLEKLQMECCEKSLPPSQEKALDLLRQIQSLLPKDPSQQNQQQNNQDQQNNQNNQNQQKQQDRQEQKDQDQQQDQQQQQKQESDQQQDQDQKKQDQQPEEKEEDKDLEATLKKAQERSAEHEAQKKARMRKVTLPPNVRDW